MKGEKLVDQKYGNKMHIIDENILYLFHRIIQKVKISNHKLKKFQPRFKFKLYFLERRKT